MVANQTRTALSWPFAATRVISARGYPDRVAQTTIDGLYARARSGDPSRPLVTFYDDSSGERTELSVATFDNWTAKTAGLILDGLLLDEGARTAVLLPCHWQAWVWLLACARSRTVAVLDDSPDTLAAVDAVVAAPETLSAGSACSGERLATSLRPMAGRFPTPPAGYSDYVAEALAQPDAFTPRSPDDPRLPLLECDGTTWTTGALAAEAAAAATRQGLTAGDRLLVEADAVTWPVVRDVLLAPLAVGASVVLVRNADPDDGRRDRRAEAERVTRRWTPEPDRA